MHQWADLKHAQNAAGNVTQDHGPGELCNCPSPAALCSTAGHVPLVSVWAATLLVMLNDAPALPAANGLQPCRAVSAVPYNHRAKCHLQLHRWCHWWLLCSCRFPALFSGCRPGFGTSILQEWPCQPCPTGTYSPGGSLSPCIRCPGSAFMVTPPQATRVNQCTCQAGGGTRGGLWDVLTVSVGVGRHRLMAGYPVRGYIQS